MVLSLPHLPALDLVSARVLLAGSLAGVAGGMAATALLLLALLRNPAARARLPAEMHFAAVGVVAVNAMLLVWTLLGLVLGAVYLYAPEPGFSASVAGACALALAGGGFVRQRVTWPMWSAALVAALAFAVLLPALAGPG